MYSFLAEEVGFEPTVLSYNGFQDRRLKPLGHSSVVHFVPFDLIYVNYMLCKIGFAVKRYTFL